MDDGEPGRANAPSRPRLRQLAGEADDPLRRPAADDPLRDRDLAFLFSVFASGVGPFRVLAYDDGVDAAAPEGPQVRIEAQASPQFDDWAAVPIHGVTR